MRWHALVALGVSLALPGCYKRWHVAPRLMPLRGAGATLVTSHDTVCVLGGDGGLVCSPIASRLQRKGIVEEARPVTGLPPIAAATLGGYQHLCALPRGGGVLCGTVFDGGRFEADPERFRSLELAGARDIRLIDSFGNDEKYVCMSNRAGIRCADVPPNPIADAPQELEGDFVSMATGGDHVCVVSSAGAVTCWWWYRHSAHDYEATTPPRIAAVLGGPEDRGRQGTLLARVAAVDDATAVTAGHGFTCALRRSGKVHCWGRNDYGQLGRGTVTAEPGAGDVAGLTDAVAVTASWQHACALRRDGSVVCWGDNGEGLPELGDPRPTGIPTPVVGVSDVAQVAAGHEFTCALSRGGEVRCWGGVSTVTVQLR